MTAGLELGQELVDKDELARGLDQGLVHGLGRAIREALYDALFDAVDEVGVVAALAKLQHDVHHPAQVSLALRQEREVALREASAAVSLSRQRRNRRTGEENISDKERERE